MENTETMQWFLLGIAEPGEDTMSFVIDKEGSVFIGYFQVSTSSFKLFTEDKTLSYGQIVYWCPVFLPQPPIGKYVVDSEVA